jgi:hypothetical protein
VIGKVIVVLDEDELDELDVAVVVGVDVGPLSVGSAVSTAFHAVVSAAAAAGPGDDTAGQTILVPAKPIRKDLKSTCSRSCRSGLKCSNQTGRRANNNCNFGNVSSYYTRP